MVGVIASLHLCGKFQLFYQKSTFDKFKNCSRAETATMSYLLSAAHSGGVAPGPYPDV